MYKSIEIEGPIGRGQIEVYEDLDEVRLDITDGAGGETALNLTWREARDLYNALAEAVASAKKHDGGE